MNDDDYPTHADLLNRAANKLVFDDNLELGMQIQELPESQDNPSRHLDYVNDGRIWLEEVLALVKRWYIGEVDEKSWRKQLMDVWMNHE